VYGIDIKDRRSGVNMFEKAGKNYSEINNEKLKILSQKGVDYIVQYSDVEMKLPILTQNREFKIYKLSL
jgi:arsenate reductase-like glutaredoxin family protein